MSDLRLDWTPGPPSTAACPCCRSHGPHAAVVSTGNPWTPGEILRFYRCASCQSLLVPGGTSHEYTDEETSPLGWRHYVQLGAGIDAMVHPAERALRADAARLLDVGCGFGFTLDYWRHATGGEAVGVEPSGFGRIGAKMLGVDLHVALLADVPELQDRLFDVVLSSEVIEHVPDPAAFVHELRRRLAPGGTLVLTTPNAGYVTPESPLAYVLATLSPGLHKLLLSQAALDGALRQAGFAHVRVDVGGQRLIAWASDVPIVLRDDAAAMRDRYIAYLARRWADSAIGPDLRLGFGYRLFKETVNAGRLDDALPVSVGLRELVRTQYGFDLADPAAVRDAVLPAPDLEAYAAAAPFPLGPVLFYRAMAAAQGSPPGEDAAAGFALAHEVLAHSVRIAPEYFQEAAALVWPALLEQAGASLRAGQTDAAASCLARLTAAETTPPADCPVAVPPEVAQRAATLRDAISPPIRPDAPVSTQQSAAQRRFGLGSIWRTLRRD